ncbi:MAG: hypothetical protein HYZ52_02740 [Candidatus Omnitrophica bacterium]|nr:hypothetical protein [Candidatus Omnitrophota bacterium]
MKIRTQWFVKHPIQGKLLLIVVLSIVVPVAVIGACFYNLVFRLLAEQIAFPEAISSNLVPVIRRINAILLIALPVLALLILSLAVAVSHKLAGPVRRLEKEIDGMLSSNTPPRPIRVRQRDDLKDLVDKINALMDRMKKP